MTKRIKLTTWLLVLVILMVISAVINLNTGEMSIKPSEIWNLLMGQGTYTQSMVIFDFRMPRIAITVLVALPWLLPEMSSSQRPKIQWLTRVFSASTREQG